MTRPNRLLFARRRLLSSAAALWVCITCATHVRADEAAELDKKARAAFEAKDYQGAAEAFREAYRNKPHPATRYNEALAWDKGGELARAADAYEAALEAEGLDAGRTEAARTRLAALKQQLAYVSVENPIGGTVTSEQIDNAAIPVRFHLAPGSHDIVVKQPSGATTQRKLSLRAGTTTILAIDAEKDVVTSTPKQTMEEPRTAPDKPPPAPTPRPEADAGCSSCSTWGWVALGGAVAAAGAGAYFGVRTLSARDDFEASNKTDADAHDRAVQSRTLTNVAFGVAAVAGGVGVYLLLSGKGSPKESARVELRVRPGGVSGGLSF